MRAHLDLGSARAAIALAMLPVLTGGCIAAAAIPVIAGGTMARERLKKKSSRRVASREGPTQPAGLQTAEARAAVAAFEGRGTGPITQSALPGPGTAAVPTGLTSLPAPNGALPPPAGGGAGEEAAASLQAYQSLWNHLSAQAAKRARGEAISSVVLAEGASLDAPSFVPCGAKPLAMIVDLDENPTRAADPSARWRRWKGDGSDPVSAVPGAVEGVEAARRAGMTVIFTTARSPESAPAVRAVLDRLGFGTAELGRTLMMRGGSAEPDADDRIRTTVASSYCVVALVGDALGDFSDKFDTPDNAGRRPTVATETMVAPLWGAGWFLLPNPVRSTAAPTPVPGAANATPDPTETNNALDS